MARHPDHNARSERHPEHVLHHDTAKEAHHHKREHGAHHEMREKVGREGPHRGGGNEGRSEEGIKSGNYATGYDASYIKPRLMPDAELLPRDDSGGPEWMPYTQQWGDGGYVTGEKAHLSARGGMDDDISEDEVSSEPRAHAGIRDEGERIQSPKRPSSSSKLARE